MDIIYTKYIQFLDQMKLGGNSELLEHFELAYYILFESVETLHMVLDRFTNKFDLSVSKWDEYVKKSYYV